MSLDAPGMVIVAGWYPDPAGNALARWWDGCQWTANTRAIDSVAPAADPAAPPVPAPLSPSEDALVAPSTTAGEAPREVNRYFSPVPVRTDAALPPIEPYRPISRRNDSQGFVSMGVKASTHFRPTRAYTGAVWAIATMPVWATIVLLALAFVLGDLYSPFLIGVTSFVLFVIAVSFAIHDQKVLSNSLHPKTASAWWMIVGPFVYLLVRGVHVSRTVGHGWVPLIIYVICCLVPTAAILTLSTLFAFVASLLNGTF